MKTAVTIDNDQLSLEIMDELLSENGYKVISFSDPDQAVEYLKQIQNPVEILFLNSKYKDIKGIELLKYLKKGMKKYSDIPVIVTSAVTQKEFVNNALNQGAEAFLDKPFDEWILMQKIRQVLK